MVVITSIISIILATFSTILTKIASFLCMYAVCMGVCVVFVWFGVRVHTIIFFLFVCHSLFRWCVSCIGDVYLRFIILYRMLHLFLSLSVCVVHVCKVYRIFFTVENVAREWNAFGRHIFFFYSNMDGNNDVLLIQIMHNLFDMNLISWKLDFYVHWTNWHFGFFFFGCFKSNNFLSTPIDTDSNNNFPGRWVMMNQCKFNDSVPHLRVNFE